MSAGVDGDIGEQVAFPWDAGQGGHNFGVAQLWDPGRLVLEIGLAIWCTPPIVRITIERWGPIATGGFPARFAEE